MKQEKYVQPKTDVEAPPHDEQAPSDQSPHLLTIANGSRSNGADSAYDSKSLPNTVSLPDGTLNSQVTQPTKREVSAFPKVATVHRGTVQRVAKRAIRKSDRSRGIETAVSRGTLDTTDTSYLSPGAVSIEGNLSSLGNSMDEDCDDDYFTEVELGTEDHRDQTVFAARLVRDDIEQIIQQAVESRLNTATTAVVAETVVATGRVDKVPPVDSNETAGPRVCGLRRRTLGWLICIALVVSLGLVVAGVILRPSAGTGSEVASPSVAPTVGIPSQSTEPPVPPRNQLLGVLEPSVIRNDQDRALFQDPESPQSLALDWLSDDETNFSEDRPTAIVLERYVLAVLYYSTNGPNWLMRDYDFLSPTTDACSWNNNKPWNDASARGIICGNQSTVEHILLEEEGLSGTIPWELSLLSNLLSLTLPKNQVTGSIPTEMFQLTLLRTLNLLGNELEGTLPSEIGKLTTLTVLTIVDNGFKGSVPSELGQLTALTHLDIAANQFSGTLPTELGRLSSLEVLFAYTNSFTGTLPTEYLAFTTLEYFSVHQNGLQGTISPEWGQMTALRDFRLSSNNLTGTLPTELGKLTGLNFLSVEGNVLEGTVPTELGQLTDIQYLFININKFHGTIPTELCLLTDLSTLLLERNSLTGTLPTQLGNLPTLRTLYMSQNSFNGTLPTELGQMTMLVDLRLSSNMFTGTLPTELGNLTASQLILMDGNSLSGTVPTELGRLTNLVDLWLNCNVLTGTLPTALGRLVNLENFHADMNRFTGSLPTEFATLTNLSDFWFFQNNVTGSANDVLCQATKQWNTLQGDCLATNGEIEIECQCCTSCCNPEGEACQEMM